MRKAFSILTLLLLIVIVAVLAAMLMPALTRARDEARRTSGGRYPDESVNADPGRRPSVDEELWVIARLDEETPADAEPGPGAGTLMAVLPGADVRVPVPLEHTDVKAHVAAYIATVDVTQRFRNPYDTKIEAVYVFPLPQNAAVTEFLMTVGERRIRGLIREREEAERIYEEARAMGQVASLLTQARPNVFEQKVANIEPGKKIDVAIRYFHTLACVDGWYEFVFPMVVGPRYNPAGSTDGVGAVARGRPARSGQATEVQYLAPGQRSGHDISLAVEVAAGVPIEEVACSSHVVVTERPGASQLKVGLSPLDSIPNRDFVLRYRVAGEAIKAGLLTHTDDRGGFFTLMVHPPLTDANVPRKPLELVFVLDCSGSMNGEPIAQAKAAIRRALQSMQPGDTFQVIRFSNSASQLGRKPVDATPKNVARALAYVDSLQGSGGTEMIEGIRAALGFAHDEDRLRFVVFLTDGYIGNETEILAEVARLLGPSRVFSFGVGSSVNRYLLDGMARLGRRAVAYLSLRDSASDVMDAFFARVSRPAMTDVTVDWGGMEVSDVYPRKIADLFVGRPVVLTGRFSGTAGPVRIRGRVGDSWEEIAADPGATVAHRALPAVWARMKIAELTDEAVAAGHGRQAEQILDLALDFGLMSAYTSFIAVDDGSRTGGNHGVTVAVPVAVPEGVRYETTVTQ